MINYLMAAKAGARLQQPDNVDQDLLAAAGEGESDLAVALSRAELQLDARNYQAGVATLLEQQSKSTLPGAGLSLLCRAYQGLSSWAEIAQLLPKLRNQKLLPLQELEQLEEQVHKALLITAIEAASSDVLNQAWAACPERLRQQGELPRLYLRGLLSCDPGGDVEKLVQRSLKTHWDSDLVVLYGLIPGKNPGKQLKAAESWLRDHEADAGLLLTLGRLSLRNELWGQARDYFERSDGLCASAETCAELARLTLGLREPETSAEWSRRGLQLAAAEIPELPQPTLDKPGAEL
jgi:HemY protein